MRRIARTTVTFAIFSALAPGGSNFNWYQVDRPTPTTCVREPYGVIANFHVPTARAQIEAELDQMFASGQRRLRIGIFHGRGYNTGTVMDSTGGNLSRQNRANLLALLRAVKTAGFTEVEVAFHPEGPAVAEWTSWNPSLFEENWNTIRNLRPLIRAAHLPYRIDLSNEAVPAPGQSLVLEYSRRLWARYTHAFGRADTVGFSVIGDPAHVGRLRAVYGSKPPAVFDIHFYDGTSGMSEAQQFAASDRLMRRQGFDQPWIIGEAFYNDATTATRLESAIRTATRPIYYLTQWPLTRGAACADVDVPAPTAFDAYAAAGFDQAAPPAPVVADRTLTVDRARTISLRIGCTDSATRCTGRAEVRVRRRTAGAVRFSVMPGQATVRRIHLSAIARHATLLLRVRSLDVATPTRRSIGLVLKAVPAARRGEAAHGSSI